jgi:hypothetical protein
MRRFSASVVFAAVSILAVPVLADSVAAPEHAGKKGYVSAYDADMSTVLSVQACDPKGLAHDYPECGKTLRARMKTDVCKKGAGKQTWYYQIGDGKKMKHTVTCK